MTADRCLRVTHSQREDSAGELRAAYAVGCLDNDELEERIGLAYAAKTRGELADLVKDLPAIPTDELAGGPAPRRPLCDWPRLLTIALAWGCWLMLTAAGAWVIIDAAGGAAAVPLVFLWLVALRLCELVRQKGRAAAPCSRATADSRLARRSASGL